MSFFLFHIPYDMVYGIPTVPTRGQGVANPYSAKFHYNFVSRQITLSGSAKRLELFLLLYYTV